MVSASTTPTPALDLPGLCLAITEHAPLPIATVEGATHIVRYANPAFCRLMDKPPEELIGKPLSELLPVKDECITLLDRVFRARRAESHIEQDDSKPHPVFWSYTMWPVLQDAGLVGVMLQVTETAEAHGKTIAINEALMLGSIRQHELVEAAEKLNVQLREEVATRERIAAELTQADRSKDEFLAMLAHELRNPLATLHNATELLKAEDGSGEERALAQSILTRQIENMTRMIDDLLDVSRITKGKIELRKKTVILETILTSAADLTRSNCAGRDQELTVNLPAQPTLLEADPTRLEQVFGNLLANACKYGGDGCHIVMNAVREDGEVVVSVIDDGTGIAEEVLPHVFDLFVQASHTLDRAHGGLGIGLTLVQRLVKLHGGSVEARSEGLGKGAEFIVRLPILHEAPLSPQPIAVSPPEPATPRRILIVDDNVDSVRSLAMIESRHGHKTRTALNGPDALAIATEFLPDVVLLDIGLPGMTGFEVAQQIRAIPALQNVLIIGMSGYGRTEDFSQAKRAGFDRYLVKPLDLDELHRLLRA